jgi:hypothetical protein
MLDSLLTVEKSFLLESIHDLRVCIFEELACEIGNKLAPDEVTDTTTGKPYFCATR